ncbi:MAG: response regulator [Bryobacteraceae bacterium]
MKTTILVVDDEAETRILTQIFLESAGYTVIGAPDGIEALKLYERHRSGVALLLTDVNMPHMNGFELADRLLLLRPDLPVLFMSGASHDADRGFGCVPKPFRREELLIHVRKALCPPGPVCQARECEAQMQNQ